MCRVTIDVCVCVCVKERWRRGCATVMICRPSISDNAGRTSRRAGLPHGHGGRDQLNLFRFISVSRCDGKTLSVKTASCSMQHLTAGTAVCVSKVPVKQRFMSSFCPVDSRSAASATRFSCKAGHCQEAQWTTDYFFVIALTRILCLFSLQPKTAPRHPSRQVEQSFLTCGCLRTLSNSAQLRQETISMGSLRHGRKLPLTWSRHPGHAGHLSSHMSEASVSLETSKRLLGIVRIRQLSTSNRWSVH